MGSNHPASTWTIWFATGGNFVLGQVPSLVLGNKIGNLWKHNHDWLLCKTRLTVFICMFNPYAHISTEWHWVVFFFTSNKNFISLFPLRAHLKSAEICRMDWKCNAHQQLYHIISRKVVFLTFTVALCLLVKAHRTLRFRIAPERALCIHTLKAESTVMALLHTLIDIWRR